jgi:hypothetical protein
MSPQIQVGLIVKLLIPFVIAMLVVLATAVQGETTR